MNTGIDLFIADVPGNGWGLLKSQCELHDGVLTTPSSKSEIDAILQVEDIDSSCGSMSIAAYGAGPTDELTFFTDDSSQADELIYANWGRGLPFNDKDVARRCTSMSLGSGYYGVWQNEECDQQYQQCGLCRASPSGGGGGGKLAFLPT